MTTQYARTSASIDPTSIKYRPVGTIAQVKTAAKKKVKNANV
jgi:hypothetical protein